MVAGAVQAWRVHDSGLLAVPPRFRRLGGSVRHLKAQGDAWPDTVTLTVDAGWLRVSAPDGAPVGAWPLEDVGVRELGAGPPRSFVVEVPGAVQLLAASAAPATDALLVALGAKRSGLG